MAVSFSAVWAIGFMYLVGSELNFLSVLIPTIIFIIGTSDCVHILSQYQDCRYICNTKREALLTTIKFLIIPCFLTTLTTMVCLFTLNVSPLEPIKHFGIFTAVGVGFAFILSISLLPIGLSIGDTRALSLKIPPSEFLHAILDKLNRVDQAHKVLILIISLAILITGIYGATKLHVETDAIKFFGNEFVGVTDTLHIEKQLGGIIPLYVVIETHEEGGIKDPSVLRKIGSLTDFIRQQEGVDKVMSASDLIKYMNYRLHDSDKTYYKIPDNQKQVAELLLMASLSDDAQLLSRFFDDLHSKTSIAIRYRHHDFHRIDKLNRTLKSYLKDHFQDISGIHAYPTGTAILCSNVLIPILTGLKQSLFIAAVTLFVLMMVLFRSVKIGLISMIPNLIPILLTLGTMGLLNIPLNFMTAPLAAIALGIAIDDTIHFLSRFRVEFKKDPDYPQAIHRTMRSVGKPIMITSIILTVGFCIFLFSTFQFTQNMGILVSFTVISAIFADLILLPVLLLIFKPLGKETTVIA